MSETDQLETVKNILIESTSIICDNLDPKTLLDTMTAKRALSPDNVSQIKSKTVERDQAGLMLNILMKKPTTSYDIFMEALRDKAERNDLYQKIKVIEKRHGYLGLSASVVDKPAGSSASPVDKPGPSSSVVKESDISEFVKQLLPNELSKVYERLGISYRDVQKAHLKAGDPDPDEKAKAVLFFWMEQNGDNATKTVLLKALEECKFIMAMQKLQVKWGIV